MHREAYDIERRLAFGRTYALLMLYATEYLQPIKRMFTLDLTRECKIIEKSAYLSVSFRCAGAIESAICQ